MSGLTEYPMSVLFYLSLLIVCTYLARVSVRRNNRFYVVLIVVLLSIVAGSRGAEVGIDTSVYLTNLENGYYYLYEPGFAALSELFAAQDSPEFYLLTIAAIIYSLFLIRLWELRETIDFPFAVFCFVAVHYAASLNTMRQYIACALVFFGTRYITQKRLWLFAGFVVVATLFHRSAILSIGLVGAYLMQWKRLNILQQLELTAFVGVSPIMAYFAYTNWFSDYVSIRLDYYFSTPTRSFGLYVLFELCSIAFLAAMSKRQTQSQTDEHRFIIRTAYLCALLGSVMALVGYYYLFMGRISLYYQVFGIVFYSAVWRSTHGGRAKRPHIWHFSISRLLIMLIILYPYLNQFSNNSYEILPYVVR